MPRPQPLPSPYARTEFSVAAAKADGVPPQRLRRTDLSAPFFGTRISGGDLSLPARCRARAQRLPEDAVFSHTTAGLLHGIPLPLEHESATALHVTVPRGRRAPEGKGTVGHQAAMVAADVAVTRGIRVTTPERTFCDLAAILTPTALVVAGDAILRRGDPALLDDALRRHGSRRFHRVLARARTLLDAGAESPKESELRVLLIDAGFPRPTANAVVRTPAGSFVARVDLAYPELRIAVEYEGDHHRDRAQWRRDIARRRRLEALGWTYLSVTQADLADPAPFLADLRQAFRRAAP